VFGLGSMFNHSQEQNVVWERDLERLLVIYKANRDIRAGEELCTYLCPLNSLL
jgi:SET domain-containing protein